MTSMNETDTSCWPARTKTRSVCLTAMSVPPACSSINAATGSPSIEMSMSSLVQLVSHAGIHLEDVFPVCREVERHDDAAAGAEGGAIEPVRRML